MLILAVDTSTDQAGIGLSDDDLVRAEWSWSAAGNHSQQLSHVFELLLSVEGVRPADLQAIVVASGPGSFSGLRVGVSFSKGLALALGVPLVGIGTLDVLGVQGSLLADSVLAAIPAGRGELYVARYAGGWEVFRRIAEPAILSPGAAAEYAGDSTLVCGPGSGAIAAEMERTGAFPRLMPPAWRLRRSAFLAELGRRYLLGGGTDQTDTLEPQYIRRSSAEEKRLGSQE